jgi:putative component of toxin-antitoxin plasmid stabilization module
MPQTTILVYRQANGDIPLVEWLDDLSTKEPKAHAKCLERILRLSELGYELRRPLADSLRDGIFELRAQVGKVHYRILYFFFGQNVAVLSHGCTKEGAVPKQEIERAIERKGQVESNPQRFTAEFEMEEE